MSEGRKRRKLYLGPSQPLTLPRSTFYYDKRHRATNGDSTSQLEPEQSVASKNAAAAELSLPGSVEEHESSIASSSGSIAHAVEDESEAEAPESGGDSRTDSEGEIEVSDEAEASDNDTQASNEDRCNGGEEDEGAYDDMSRENTAVPQFDQSELLGKCMDDFGSKTLPGSKTTVAVAIVLIMSFVVAHGLPWSAVDDLLKLVDALFGFQNCGLPRSKYLLRKLWSPKCQSVVNYHYFCDTCTSLLKPMTDRLHLWCDVCQISSIISAVKSAGNFFVILDLKSQISGLIGKLKGGLYENLCLLKQQAQEGSRVLQDITSGNIHRSLHQKGVLNWSDLTVNVNTDGSPLFKSSNASVWPIQLIVNELPLPLRHQNTVLAGLWFGRKHPDMLLFLSKFVDALGHIGQLVWEHGSASVYTKVNAICICVDAPARASVGNHVQFNGFFGCPWCLSCGTSKEGRWLYIDSVPGTERTTAGVRRDMKLALKYEIPVNGLKGPSPLVRLPGLDLVWCYTVEYMHCVLLGVTRQFTDYWLDSSNSHEPYYIGRPNLLEKLNKRLLSIRPPHHFTRLPRNLRERCYWKAHEWRNWLLFYSIPCCRHILPGRYLRHFGLLSQAIFILLKESLTLELTHHAERLLGRFVQHAAGLYGQRSMSFNLHQLLHMAQAARNFGPLWAHSAFTFESGNGQIVKLVNAAKGVPEQILERIILSQELDLLLTAFPLPTNVKEVCLGFLGHSSTQSARHVSGACIFGTPKSAFCLSPQETACLEALLGGVPQLQEHFRFSFLGTIFHSELYRAGKKNCTVFESTDGGFYTIKRIFEILDTSCLAFGKLVMICAKIVTEDNDEEFPPHISQCFFSLVYSLVTLHVSDIAKPSVLISFGDSEQYICSIPNLIERD